MKEKIKEINDYFVQKIVNKDYEFLFMDSFFYSISIDGHRFDIWMPNGYECISTNYSTNKSFMTLDFTEEEKKIIYNNITSTNADLMKEIKLENYNKLKEELGL
jgi:hypothetical protein